MRKKTEGLTFPTNPLATMRELQDLDARPAPTPEPREETPPPITSSAAVETASLPTETATTPTDTTTALPVTHTTSNTTALPKKSDPLRDALIQAIQQPVEGELGKGPFTVSSIKVHNTVWERLGYVSQLTGRNKQDLVSEALLDLFAKVVRGEGGM